MKTVLLPLLACLVLSLPGCVVAEYPAPATYPDDPACPGYVYTYDGGCWADDVWYAPCPWAPGPSYGYYVWYGGGFHFYAGAVWAYRPGLPPPHHWHRSYVPRPYEYHAAPRYYHAHPHAGPHGR